MDLYIPRFARQCMDLSRREFSSSEIKSSRYTCIRKLQDLGHIDHDDYLLVVCCYETLMEIFLRGRNSRPFFLPTNARFVIKILQKYEVKILKDMIPDYYSHIYFVVMENLLKSEFNIHKRYDLKGTSKGRTNNKTITFQRITLKDLEFDLCFYINSRVRNQVLEQIKNDCKFLEEQHIMDYSLLLGIHIIPRRDLFNLRQYIKQHGGLGLHGSRKIGSSEESCSNTYGEITEIPLDVHHKRDPTLADFFESADRFGANLPARAMKGPRGEESDTPASNLSRTQECREVLLYFGIIDFLQGYTIKKKIEHAYKSLQFNSKSIPSVKPKVYSARFQEFLARVFQAEDDENSLLES
ncbi:hypothetical protein V2J09_013966 [Rumex salicifolius]